MATLENLEKKYEKTGISTQKATNNIVNNKPSLRSLIEDNSTI